MWQDKPKPTSTSHQDINDFFLLKMVFPLKKLIQTYIKYVFYIHVLYVAISFVSYRRGQRSLKGFIRNPLTLVFKGFDGLKVGQTHMLAKLGRTHEVHERMRFR